MLSIRLDCSIAKAESSRRQREIWIVPGHPAAACGGARGFGLPGRPNGNDRVGRRASNRQRRAATEETVELPFRETAMVTLTDKEERG